MGRRLFLSTLCGGLLAALAAEAEQTVCYPPWLKVRVLIRSVPRIALAARDVD